MKEFIRKWSNWWILAPNRKQLDDAFESELNQLIEREVALRLHSVSNSIAIEYAEFCVRCDRKKLPLISLGDYIKNIAANGFGLGEVAEPEAK